MPSAILPFASIRCHALRSSSKDLKPDHKGNTMNLDNLTPEQQEKARACKTPEDVIALAKQEGYELSDDELKEVSGGVSWSCISDCPDHAPCPSDR